jgi:CheY-like chemotaxis protein
MVEQKLQGCRVLIVEDEYLLADDLSQALADVGVQVLGPVASVEDGMTLIGSEASIDAAVLDVNLRGDMVFPVADALLSRGIPFAFATGYDEWALPERFANAPRVEKPFKGYKVAAILGTMIGDAPEP